MHSPLQCKKSFTHIISPDPGKSLEVGTIILPIAQMWELRLKNDRGLARVTQPVSSRYRVSVITHSPLLPLSLSHMTLLPPSAPELTADPGVPPQLSLQRKKPGSCPCYSSRATNTGSALDPEKIREAAPDVARLQPNCDPR